jgi:ATP-dependent HslUV protease ATP-binding subunit HslU
MTDTVPETTDSATDASAPAPWLEEMPPRQIVAELDRYIVGQDAAKKAVAIAVRNRWRRAQAPDDIRDEITPYNIIMIGPTGVGKTEVARRLARLNMVRTEREDEVYPQAEQRADERLLDLLLPPVAAVTDRAGKTDQADGASVFVVGPAGQAAAEPLPGEEERRQRSREKLRKLLADGELDEREVEIEVAPQSFPMLEFMQPPQGMEGADFNFTEMLQEMMPKRKKRRTVKVPEARRILVDEELKKLVDMDDVVNESLDRVENHGIIFIDEIDKIAGERTQGGGPDVSREGVQRDLLPIVEGSTVQTRYGYVRSDHILFIAAGAFHVSKPSDLIPELQGRFPIRVELTPLTEQDFIRIMTEPENALTKQYQALVAAEGAELEFTPEGIAEVARVAFYANDRMENIGARRLHTVMATLMEDLLFELPEHPDKRFVYDAVKVKDRLSKIVSDDDLRRYIL